MEFFHESTNAHLVSGILAGTTHTDLITRFVTIVPGNEEDQYSYSSELAGILYVAESIVKNHSVSSGKLTLSLDGKEALRQASSNFPLRAGQCCFDLLLAIRQSISALPIKLEWHWVERHQDAAKEIRDLDWWAQQNVVFDSHAKEFWNTCTTQRRDNIPRTLRHELISIWRQDKKLARFDIETMYTELFGQHTTAYWGQKHDI